MAADDAGVGMAMQQRPSFSLREASQTEVS